MSIGKEIRPHIGLFGRRNNGKSSIINAITKQDIAIVSDTLGTTTDPVKKIIEIPGLGPVVLIDTAGIDDIGDLGKLRINKTLQVIKQIDLAILVIAENEFGSHEEDLIKEFIEYFVPFIIVQNKSDLFEIDAAVQTELGRKYNADIFNFSAINPTNLEELVAVIRKNIPETAYQKNSLIGDLVGYGDVVLLITPIDIEAPEGRLILPQIQTIRDVLDNDCIAIVLKEREVDVFLKKTGIKPKLAITDSQIFLKADASIPKDIPLTGFSVLLAKYKGDFENYLKGTPKILSLKDGDRILLLESCTHHVACDDIGRIKIPRWLSQFTGKNLSYEVVTGLDELPRDIKDYALVIQCGGCMITRKQIVNRLKPALDAGVPVTNYGMTIAFVQGIYDRAVAPFVNNDKDNADYL